jgi:hypothetical protein
MRQPIKLIIKKGMVRKDGTSLIFLQYCYSKQRRVLISTDIGKYRDLFVLACLTGFRFSDLTDLSASELRKGMLHVIQKKTSAIVIVPLRQDARKILIDKYDMQMPKVSMVNFNYYVKEVARLAGIAQPVMIAHRKGNKIIEELRPKYAWISSHTARRSFCTNETWQELHRT